MSIEVRGVCALLQVFDMLTSVRFYRDVRLSDAQVMLNTAYEQEDRPARPEPARVAAHGDTCLYIGCLEVDAAYRHLRGHAIDAQEPRIAPYGMKQLYVRDPDGYELCFQCPAG